MIRRGTVKVPDFKTHHFARITACKIRELCFFRVLSRFFSWVCIIQSKIVARLGGQISRMPHRVWARVLRSRMARASTSCIFALLFRCSALFCGFSERASELCAFLRVMRCARSLEVYALVFSFSMIPQPVFGIIRSRICTYKKKRWLFSRMARPCSGPFWVLLLARAARQRAGVVCVVVLCRVVLCRVVAHIRIRLIPICEIICVV